MRFVTRKNLLCTLVTILSIGGFLVIGGIVRADAFDPDDPLKGLSPGPPTLNWPEPPPPLPTDVVAFCTEQEQLMYWHFTLGPLFQQAKDLYERAHQYYTEVSLRLSTVVNQLRDFQNKERDHPGSIDPQEIAKWTKAKATLEPAEAVRKAFLDDAQKRLDEFTNYNTQVNKAKIVACLCDEVAMAKGLGAMQIDSRGKPHLPGKKYIYTHNKPGDAGYSKLEITAKPEVGRCFKKDNEETNVSETHISFPLFGGNTIVPQYFDWKVQDGTMPDSFFPAGDLSKMSITYDNGKVVDSTGSSDGGAVPAGAKSVKRIEMLMLDGGWDAEGKLTTTKLEWAGQ